MQEVQMLPNDVYVALAATIVALITVGSWTSALRQKASMGAQLVFALGGAMVGALIASPVLYIFHRPPPAHVVVHAGDDPDLVDPEADDDDSVVEEWLAWQGKDPKPDIVQYLASNGEVRKPAEAALAESDFWIDAVHEDKCFGNAEHPCRGADDAFAQGWHAYTESTFTIRPKSGTLVEGQKLVTVFGGWAKEVTPDPPIWSPDTNALPGDVDLQLLVEPQDDTSRTRLWSTTYTVPPDLSLGEDGMLRVQLAGTTKRDDAPRSLTMDPRLFKSKKGMPQVRLTFSLPTAPAAFHWSSWSEGRGWDEAGGAKAPDISADRPLRSREGRSLMPASRSRLKWEIERNQVEEPMILMLKHTDGLPRT